MFAKYTVHPQNVQLQNVQLQDVQLQDVKITKRPVYQLSRLPDVQITKRSVTTYTNQIYTWLYLLNLYNVITFSILFVKKQMMVS
jgi:hypothetical protein